MKYVRVRDKETGHELSTPENDPLIKKGRLEVVDRKSATPLPLPPNPKNTLPPAGTNKREAS